MRFFRKKSGDAATSPIADQSKRRHSKPSPLEVKLLALEALSEGLTQRDVAEIIGVGPQTVGNWQKLYDEGGLAALYGRPSSPGARHQCKTLRERIVAHRVAHPDHGVRRTRDELRRHEGLEVSAETVRKTFNEAGLPRPAPKKKRGRPAVQRFERSLPNALWQIDIFTFELKQMYRVYLIGIIDDHSRYLVGWGLHRQQTAEAVLEVVKGAIGQWGAPREILSDNGRQFVSWRGKSRFQQLLRTRGIGHVRSAPHHPMTLGKIERFWQTIWREFLEEARFASFADACQRLDHWVQYYNHQRPHQGIEGACPADRFYGVSKDVEEAIRQGCKENALKLAHGEAPQPPMYLLGRLGTTDVRVVRQGEELEIKVGDTVRERIRLGAPYTIGEDGHGQRREAEVERSDGRGEVGSDPGESARQGEDARPVRKLRDDAADAASLQGDSRARGEVRSGATKSGSQAPPGGREADRGAPRGTRGHAERARPHAPALRGDEDATESRAEAVRRRFAHRGSGGKRWSSRKLSARDECSGDKDDDGDGGTT